MTEEPTSAETLYLDAEHFDLTAQAQPLRPRSRVEPIGPPFAGFPREQPKTEQET